MSYITDLKKIVIVAGHYGSGKTNIAVNLAMQSASEGFRTAIADMDIVNPYFRAADAKQRMTELGIRCVIPEYANSNVDVPSLPAELYSLFLPDAPYDRIFLDLGGDDGAVALGMYSALISDVGYDMIAVISKFRPLTANAEDSAEHIREIESASRLKCTYIANNSSIGEETAESDVAESVSYAREVERLTGLPLLFTSYYSELLPNLKLNDTKLFAMKNVTKQMF